MNKIKHNKKRNTAFLYEIVIREITQCILEKKEREKKYLLELCKHYFSSNNILKKELDLYNALNNTFEVEKDIAEKILREAKYQYDILDKKKIFIEQTKLINNLNNFNNGKIFSNFVPDYKNLATISQVFNNSIAIKEKVLLENNIVQKMCSLKENTENTKMETLDTLAYKMFVKKFNEQYGSTLLGEQKDLITRYVMSFADNGLEFKIFLNEEIDRIKKELKKSLENKNISADRSMTEKTNLILNKVNMYKERNIDSLMIQEVLKIQSLIKEIDSEEENKNG
jgi:hypothetical protein